MLYCSAVTLGIVVMSERLIKVISVRLDTLPRNVPIYGTLRTSCVFIN